MNRFVHTISIFRAVEWWEFKLPPLLAVAYATLWMSESFHVTQVLLAVGYLGMIAVGAVYVSVINDITDLQDDLASGKRNRMAAIPARWRWLPPTGCALLGILFSTLLWPDQRSITLYALAWVAFSLYSIPPFRFKNRGILGVLCDASGAHLFPSLFMVSGMYTALNQAFDPIWFCSVAIWAFTYGLRGILWHQFCDRENDLQANVKTLATQILPNNFKPYERLIFSIELVTFAIMLLLLASWLVILSLIPYAVLIYTRLHVLGKSSVVIMTSKSTESEILMADFYRIFFPIALIVSGALHQPIMWLVLAAHLLIFPKGFFFVLADYGRLIRHLKRFY